MTRRRSLLPCLLATLLTPAHADFESAMTAYQAKNFAAAEVEFRRLAELGDAPSQRNLAAMYARGEHVVADLATAWAWASLAAETDSDSLPLRDTLRRKLNEPEAQRAEEVLGKLRQSYGQEALGKTLMPIPADREADCTVDVRSEARILKRKAPAYPKAAAKDDIEGDVCVAFYMTREGTARRGWILSAATKPHVKLSGDAQAKHAEAFASVSLEALKEAVFVPPASEALREVPASYCIRFRMGAEPPKEFTVVRDLERQADAGQARAQFELAEIGSRMVSMGNLTRGARRDLVDTVHRRYLQSAVNGYAPAQFFIAKRLLTGDQCEKEIDKGVAWLALAAQQGNVDAQYLLATHLFHGDGVARDPDKALEWLESAAKGGHPQAKVEFAPYLLRYSPGRRSDALALLPVEPSRNDMGELERAALAAAMRGDFAKAEAFQREAIAIATELDFALDDRRRLLEDFAAGRLPPELATPQP